MGQSKFYSSSHNFCTQKHLNLSNSQKDIFDDIDLIIDNTQFYIEDKTKCFLNSHYKISRNPNIVRHILEYSQDNWLNSFLYSLIDYFCT